MAGSQGGFRWTSQDLQTNLRNAPARVEKALARATEYQATRSENWMRANAKWTDRTANARNGLRAYPVHLGHEYMVILSHGVPYGIWLEVRWSGKYGVIPDAVRTGGQEFMGLLSTLFAGLTT